MFSKTTQLSSLSTKTNKKETSMFLGYQNINDPRPSKLEQTERLNQFIEQLKLIVPTLGIEKVTSGVRIHLDHTPLTISTTYIDGVSWVKLYYKELELASMERKALSFDAYVFYRFDLNAIKQLSQRLSSIDEGLEKQDQVTLS